MNTTKQKLFEVTCTAYKTFFVEAESQENALMNPLLQDEERPNSRGEFDWEHDETTARDVSAEQAKYIREHQPELIAKEY